LNLSLPPQRKTPKGVSLGSLVMFRDSIGCRRLLLNLEFTIAYAGVFGFSVRPVADKGRPGHHGDGTLFGFSSRDRMHEAVESPGLRQLPHKLSPRLTESPKSVCACHGWRFVNLLFVVELFKVMLNRVQECKTR
jgi:hypothetical protein